MNYYMDKKTIEEIRTLFHECKELKTQYIECHKNMKKEYFMYKNSYNQKAIKSSDSAITDLKLVLSYLKKHNELKMVYQSYKEILKLMLEYKKKLIYFASISKSSITEEHMIQMLQEQNDIMNTIEQLNGILPKFK